MPRLATLALALPPLFAIVTGSLFAPPWHWPVDAPHAIVRPFVAPATAYSAGHRGVDLAAGGGTVYAPADGVVRFVGVVVDRPVLSIEHPGGLVTSYEPVTSTLAAGQLVARGEVVGIVAGGHCASACLHFGVRLDGRYVSPLAYLGGLRPSVLLPTRW
jgi:murein DD-endopeptidase MepM/ murein hydrolase activator NlpD